MMGWLFYAVIARFFLAASNIVDQTIARAYGHRRIVSAVVLQNLMAGVALVFIGVFHGVPSSVDQSFLFWLNLGVVANLCSLYPYLTALHKDEPHNVIPFFEFVPVLLMLFAFILFGETLSPVAWCYAFIFVICGFLFLWDFEKSRLKAQSVFLMLAASFLYAVYYLTLRKAGLDKMDPLDVLWHINCGFFAAAIVATFAFKRAIGNIRLAIASTRGRIILYEVLSGTFMQGAALCIIVSLALAPTTAHFAAFSGIQPVFIYVMGAIASFFAPTLFARPKWGRDMQIKIVLLILMGMAGAILIHS